MPERAASPRYFRALLLAGLVLRAAALPLRGTDDLDVWKLWSYAGSTSVTTMYGVGGNPPQRAVLTWGARRGTVEYPPATLLALSLVGRAYRAIDPSYSDGPALSAAIKLTLLVGDIGVCLAVWALMRRYPPVVARTAILFYWLNPAVILDGAVLGYLDPWLGALTMTAWLAVDQGAYACAGAALALTVLTKLQIVLILPALALFALHRSGRDWWKATLSAALAAGTVMAAVIAPFARIGALPNLVQGTLRAFHQDMLSGEAANVWWIVTWLLRAFYAARQFGAWAAFTLQVRILGVSRVVALGYPNAKLIGTIASSAVMLWAFWRARRGSLAILLASGACAMHAYALLSAQVHENHLYLALPLIAAAGALLPTMRGPYALTSLVCLLNMFFFQGLGHDFRLPPRGFTIVDVTVVLSFVNVGAFVWHARRFAAACASDQSARPAAVNLYGGAGHVRSPG